MKVSLMINNVFEKLVDNRMCFIYRLSYTENNI